MAPRGAAGAGYRKGNDIDPNAALQRIIEAATDGDAIELREAAGDLADWLERGGYSPVHDRSGYRLLVNEARTVCVTLWDNGRSEVALRDHPADIWGAPIELKAER